MLKRQRRLLGQAVPSRKGLIGFHAGVCGDHVINGVVADHEADFRRQFDFLTDLQIILDPWFAERHVFDVILFTPNTTHPSTR